MTGIQISFAVRKRKSLLGQEEVEWIEFIVPVAEQRRGVSPCRVKGAILTWCVRNVSAMEPLLRG